MGLDMYLSARLYTSEYTNPAAHALLSELKLPGTERPHNGEDRGAITIEYPVMYWRKANAIHAWFVHNVQDGKDECQYADVSEEQLRDLFFLVGELIDKKDPKLVKEKMPPCEGFFFGDTEIDEWFWGSLQDTHDILAKLIIDQLDGGKLKGWDFIYHSSW